MIPAKTVILGLDGANMTVLRPLLEAGKLPNLENLFKKGSSGTLESIPPITPPAWTSIYTGVNSGKHGIYGFSKFNPDPSKKAFSLVTFEPGQQVAMWDAFKIAGKRVAMFNLPFSYPAPAVDGVFISGMGTPDLSSDKFVYPRELKEEILANFPDFKADWAFEFNESKNNEKFLEKLIRQDQARLDVALHLARETNEDLFMIVLQLTDLSCHLFWNDSFIQENGERTLDQGSLLAKAYIAIDGLVGKLMSECDPSASMFVISDHGYGQYNEAFLANNWLKDNGYLCLKKSTGLGRLRRFLPATKRFKIKKFVKRLGLSALISKLPPRILNRTVRVPVFRPVDQLSSVDWSRTSAYAENFGIFINLKGRQTTGIVEQGAEYDGLVAEISSKLRLLSDDRTGKKVAQRVCSSRELYSGPKIDQAHDINLQMTDGYYQLDSFQFGRNFKNLNFGSHDINGIFIAHGPLFKKDFIAGTKKITDVMPTVLAVSGLAIPRAVDGKVMMDCLNDEAAALIEVRFMDGGLQIADGPDGKDIGHPPQTQETSDVYDESEKEMISEQLKRLGYL